MEDAILKDLWKAQDEKLERSLQINLFLLNSLQKDKARSKLDQLARFKTFAVILGLVWCAFLGLLIYGNNFKNIYFEISAGAILLFSIYACVVYIQQIIFIKKLDYSGSVISTQRKLAKLQLSTINTTRILLLQLPFYTTWFYTPQLVVHDLTFQVISFSVTLLFILLAIWLYKAISIENMHKKWLRTFMNMGPEYKSVTEASTFLSDLEKFQTG
jgi:hypothetical protein